MRATDFLCIQLVGSAVALYTTRRLLKGQATSVLRLLLFVAAASYSFDFIANDRLIWRFHGSWDISLILNPLENTLFAATMALDLLLIYLVLGNRSAKKARK